MSDPLRLVVFDMDGTLIDSAALIQQAMRHACAQIGRAVPSESDVRATIGLSLAESVGRLMPELDRGAVHATAEIYKQSFIDLRARSSATGDGAPLYDGALDALEHLQCQDEVLMGIATGKARRGVDHAFEEHDIGDFFLTVQTADNHPSKPHPSMLHQALRETGTVARSAVMIGDTSFDMAMGRAAGYMTIGVCWGYHSVDELALAGADLLIDNYDQLPEALNDLWSRQ